MKHISIKICLLLLSLILMLSFVSCSAAKDGYANEEHWNEIGDAEQSKPGEGILTNDSSLQSGAQAELRKIIKTYHVDGQCKDFDAAMALVNTLIAENGGYIESLSLRGSADNGDRRYATCTIRIPAEKADAFVGSLSGELNIISSSAEVKDVSESYYSIESRLEELEAERDSLLAMMQSLDSKVDYDFWLTLQTRLSDVRQQIAVYQGQIKLYDSQVSYSTVHLNFRETQTYEKKDTFASRIGASFGESWESFGEGFEDFVVFLVGAVPTLLVLAVIAVAGILLLKALLGKRKKKKDIESRKENQKEE